MTSLLVLAMQLIIVFLCQLDCVNSHTSVFGFIANVVATQGA